MVLVVIGLVTACSPAPAVPGRLEGEVTIGPIWPVEREGDVREIPCEVYQARKIMVYDKGGKRLIEQVDIDCNGHYSVELAPGSYLVDINQLGIDHSSQVPKTLEISSGETLRLDIDIDTGIR